MLGYMNAEALEKTQATGRVTFYSRSKGRLWTKGEESGNFLIFSAYKLDCDQDALWSMPNPRDLPVILVPIAAGKRKTAAVLGFFPNWKKPSPNVKMRMPIPAMSLRSLKGINKIAQKLGEEAVETVIEAKDDNSELFLNESADLLFHYLILLQAKGFSLKDIEAVLENRKR